MKSWTPVRSLRFLSGFLFTLGLGLSAKAQDVLWDSAYPITGDSNLITSGTEFDALLTNSGSQTTSPISVDNLTFNLATPTSSTATSATDGLISWNITSGDSQRYEFTDFSAPGASPAFDALMDSGGVYSDGGSATGIVTLSGLTTGNLYSIQVFQWADDNDPGLITLSGKLSTTLNDGGSTSSLGQFALGSFVATGPTETFGWSGDGSSYTPLGPISVQDFGYVGPYDTPEPSSFSLVCCGLSLLFISRWFRRRSRRPR